MKEPYLLCVKPYRMGASRKL